MSFEDLTKPLTPPHLILGHRLQVMPHATRKKPSKGNKIQNFNLKILLKIPINGYFNRTRRLNTFGQNGRRNLVTWRDNHNYKSTEAKCTIKKGEVCVVYEHNCPRAFWRLAHVEHLIPSHDVQIQGAVIEIITNRGGVSILRQPVQYLYPLELLNDEICGILPFCTEV